MAVGLGIVGLAVIVAVLATLIAPLIRYIKLWHNFNKFVGPSAIPFLGNAHQLKQDPNELVQQVNWWFEQHREKGNGIMRLWLGPVPALFVFECKAVEQILSSSRHLRKSFMYSFLEPWLGLGLLTSAGEKWFHRRKMLTPTFHFSILQNFIDVFNEQSAILCQKLEEHASKKDPVDICPLVTLCVLDIIGETAMGKQLHAQENAHDEYVKAVVRMSDLIQDRQKKPWYWPSPLYDITKAGKQHDHYLQILHKMTNTLIDERLAEPPKVFSQDNNNSIKQRIAFLDLLLKMQQEDPSFTKEDIREEVDTFMFEGHDTTAALASWALFVIAHQLKVQERLQEELDAVFGNSDRPVTSADFQKLPYLTCVLKECLRLFPSVPLIGRDIQEDMIIDGKFVPKDTLVVVTIGALHRDPVIFPNPMDFNPDRFLPENAAKRHPYAYVPFSAGPRNCIGQKFAMMEDKIIVAHVLRRFSLSSEQGLVEAKPRAELILRAAEGLHIKFKRRK